MSEKFLRVVKEISSNIFWQLYFLGRFSIYRYDSRYDIFINRLIDGNLLRFKDSEDYNEDNPHCLHYKNLRVWIANYPYGFGNPYIKVRKDKGFLPRTYKIRPSKKTIFRLKRYVDNYLKEYKRDKKHPLDLVE